MNPAIQTGPTSPSPNATYAHHGLAEAPLQAYVRQLHERNARRSPDGEPVRGKDPWLGMVL